MNPIWRWLIALALGFVVCMTEGGLFETAYGGLFTTLLEWGKDFICYAIAMVVSFIIGLTFRIPEIGDAWRRLGKKRLLISAFGIALMFGAGAIGLRTLEPNSGYRMMPFMPWFICLVLIAFPIVNFPSKKIEVLAAEVPPAKPDPYAWRSKEAKEQRPSPRGR